MKLSHKEHNGPTFSFVGETKHATDKAYLVSDGEAQYWIPKSQIISMEHVKDRAYEFEIPEWLAIEKEMV